MKVGEKNRPGDVVEHVALIVLQNGLQGVALEQNAALEVAEADARRGGRVTHNGAGFERDPISGDPGAPAEIDILQIREVVVVEPTHGQQRLAARDHVASAGEQQLGSLRWLLAGAYWISEAVLEGMTIERHQAAHEVDELSGEVDDFSTDGHDVLGRVIDGSKHRLQPARLRSRVIVEEDHVPRGRAGHAGGDSAGESMIGAEGKKTDVGI